MNDGDDGSVEVRQKRILSSRLKSCVVSDCLREMICRR